MGCLLAIGALALLGGLLWLVEGLVALLAPLIGETAADSFGILIFLAILGGMAWYNRRARIARGGYDDPMPSSGIGSALAILLGAVFGFGISRRNRRDRY